jgi:hypothetical protein
MRKLTLQLILFILGSLTLFYAAIVLVYASSSYELGINSLFTPVVIGYSRGEDGREKIGDLQSGDKIVKVGELPIHIWSDLLRAPGVITLSLENHPAPEWIRDDPITEQRFVRVEYERPGDPQTRQTWCALCPVPMREIVPSVLWLFLKGALFVVGALVYWKRPHDEAALRFYILCVVTLGAYIGGYHWTHILPQPALVIVFMICAILLPVASLHFYLVFPRKKRWLQEYPRRMLLAVYGLPLCTLAGLIGFYGYIRIVPSDLALRDYFPWMVYLCFVVVTLWYIACNISLVHSWRTVQDPMELKQVRCILFGIVLSSVPIAYSLYIVIMRPEEFADGEVTWPMFLASFIVTCAFAIGMTRYRLMELDTIINSSVGYFFVSFLAGLMYYGVVFVGTFFFSRFLSYPTLPAALTVSTTALLFVVALDLARNRFIQALDRRSAVGRPLVDDDCRVAQCRARLRLASARRNGNLSSCGSSRWTAWRTGIGHRRSACRKLEEGARSGNPHKA